jgi:hypothetical protein
MLNKNILKYNNKILSQERKKQKISLESAASSLTLSVNQIKSLESNLSYGFITAHFKSIAIKRYAKLLEIDLSKIIISDTEPEQELVGTNLEDKLVMNFSVNNIKRLIPLILLNLKLTKKNIFVSLILIGLILFLILPRDPHLSNKISITEINTSGPEFSADDDFLPPVTDDFNKIKKLKFLPKQDGIISENDSTSPESIEFLCTIKSASMDKIWSRAKPEKPATYFHIISQEKQSICTIDNRGIFRKYDLGKGGKITHRGEAPFKVQLNPSISELYFQGWKVILGETDTFVQLNPVKLTLEP